MDATISKPDTRRRDLLHPLLQRSLIATLRLADFINKTATAITRDTARADVFDYIERFYNPKRRHSKLGYLSPMAFGDRDMQT